jgi:hypothetical protein
LSLLHNNRSFSQQHRNLKRDLDSIDPVEEASFAAMGAVAALVARNPSALTKQANFAADLITPLVHL